MNRSKTRRTLMRAAISGGGLLAVSAMPALAANECSKFGKPSYEADRSVSIGGQVTRSKVYASGDMEREEIDRGGGMTEVIIIGNGQFISFSPEAKRGIRRSIGAGGGGPKAPAGSVRSREEPIAGGSRLILEAKSDTGDWTTINEVTCRSDGALLSRNSTVPVNGAMVKTSMSQSVRPSGPVNPGLFKAPADIRF